MIDSDVTKTADKEVPGPCPLTNTHGNTDDTMECCQNYRNQLSSSNNQTPKQKATFKMIGNFMAFMLILFPYPPGIMEGSLLIHGKKSRTCL